MTIATVMVHLDWGRSNSQVLDTAAWLAQHLDAGVIGIAGSQALQLDAGDGFHSAGLIDAKHNIAAIELLRGQVHSYSDRWKPLSLPRDVLQAGGSQNPTSNFNH